MVAALRLSSAAALSKMRELTSDILVLRMQVQFDFNRNKYFDTKEALEYGIIDQVVKPLRTQTLGV